MRTSGTEVIGDFGAPPADQGVPDQMVENAGEAAAFLKTLAHRGRLMILCHLSQGELSVSELETRLGQRQAAVSQQLARLRQEGLVSSRRDGKTVYYMLPEGKARLTISLLYDLFCEPG